MTEQATGGTVLETRNVHAAYIKKEVLRGVTLSVGEGEIVALFGGNGAGKSTVLKVIAGLLHPVEGLVKLGGEDITRKEVLYRQQRGIAYLLQGGRVFPNLSVWENLELAARHSPKGRNKDNDVIAGTFFPRIRDLAARRAGLLSGGERQMLAIEMVLCQSPKVALLDEPTGALAPTLATQILSRIRVFARENECGVLLVEQNIAEAKQVSDRSLHLRDGIVC